MGRTKGSKSTIGTKAADGKVFAFSLENVEYFQTIEKEEASMSNTVKRLMLYALVDNAMRDTYAHQAKKMEKYYGMPEYKGLGVSANELIKAGARGVKKGLVSFDIETAKIRRDNNIVKNCESSTVHGYLNLYSKHEMIDYILAAAKKRYTNLTWYYQEELVLAHKGGIEGSIADHTVEEVYEALNKAAKQNHLATIEKRAKQNVSVGEGAVYSYFQAERLINAIAPGCARWEDISHKREVKKTGTSVVCKRGRKKMTERVGQTNVHKKTGILMTLINYENAYDVDIQLENGVILHHKEFKAFKNGTAKIPAAIANDK